MKILYFAWVRDKIGHSPELAPMPEHLGDVNALVNHLKTLSDGHGAAFAHMDAIRVAVNQEFVPLSATLKDSDEVAFFPPVTGG